jgi:hypothetical protein
MRVVALVSMVEGGSGSGVLCIRGASRHLGLGNGSVVGRGSPGWCVTAGCDGSVVCLSSVGGGRPPSAPSESFARLQPWPAMLTP